MTWPTTPVSTTHLDAGTDSPASARADLKTAVDRVNEMIAARGVASGVAALDAAGLVPQAQVPQIPVFRQFMDTTPGSRTWTVPAGVTRVAVTVFGGGGGGGYTSVGTGGDHGGGGGAGGGVRKIFETVPGSVFDYTIGSGGAGKSSSSDGDGGNGGDTTCTSPASATPASHVISGLGGLGGLGPPTRFGGGGNGWSGSAVGDLTYQGGSGASGQARGGMGGGNAFAGGVAGFFPGAGFGGGGFGSGGGTPGFNGMPGGILFEY